MRGHVMSRPQLIDFQVLAVKLFMSLCPDMVWDVQGG